MPKSIFCVITQSHTGHTHLREERTTCPGVTSVSSLTRHPHQNPPSCRACLPGAGPATRHPAQPAPAGAAVSPLLPARPAPRAKTHSGRFGKSHPGGNSSSLKATAPSHQCQLVHGKDLAVIHALRFAGICSMPGSEAAQPAKDGQGCCSTHSSSSAPCGAGTFGVLRLCHSSCPGQLFSSSFVSLLQW